MRTLFWLTVAHLALSTFVLVGVLSRVDPSYFEGTLTHALGLLGKFAGDVLVVRAYIGVARKAEEPEPHYQTPVVRSKPYYDDDDDLPF